MNNVRKIGSFFDVANGRGVSYMGENTERDTAIGSVRVLVNGAIAFLAKDGEEILELTEEQAHEVWAAFMRAEFAARAVREKLTGYDVLRVRIGAVEAPHGGRLRYIGTHRGVEAWLRLSTLRRPRTCRWCKVKVVEMYVAADMPRGHFTEACPECVHKLVTTPTTIREVTP